MKHLKNGLILLKPNNFTMSYLSEIEVKVKYPIDWETSKRIAKATKVLLLPESNLDANDPESLIFRGGEQNEE